MSLFGNAIILLGQWGRGSLRNAALAREYMFWNLKIFLFYALIGFQRQEPLNTFEFFSLVCDQWGNIWCKVYGLIMHVLALEKIH